MLNINELRVLHAKTHLGQGSCGNIEDFALSMQFHILWKAKSEWNVKGEEQTFAKRTLELHLYRDFITDFIRAVCIQAGYRTINVRSEGKFETSRHVARKVDTMPVISRRITSLNFAKHKPVS